MATYKADARDMKFVLTEQLDAQKLFGLPSFSDFGVEDVSVFIDEGVKMAADLVAPINVDADRIGCKFEDGKVTTPPGMIEAYKTYAESGYVTLSLSAENGGMGLPETLGSALGEIFTSACMAFTLMPGLSRAACNVLAGFGSDEQKKMFLEKMVTGEWAGTMCLTEPQAGSDLACVKTSATKDGDHYKIQGVKSFISSGDHDMTDNIIHLVLAKTPGGPAGVKGISLFIVPKFRVAEDGGVGEPNDVACGGIEHKMGIHGSPTCTLNFGENGNCIGYLLGEEFQGIRYMFTMMNEERLMVGMQGLSLAAGAYQAALQFSNERIQGPSFKNFKDPEAPRVPIIQHPDVRRMLLTMKAYTDGLRALMAHVGFYLDVAHHSEDEKEKEKYSGLVELLTPICKAYSTDMAFRVTELGIQVHGGYGFCCEYPAEQYMRDCKITSIYEGTNGIQAMDLLSRKIGLKGGQVLMGFMGMLNELVQANKANEDLKGAVAILDEAKNKVAEAALQFQQSMMSKEVLSPLLSAVPFLEMFGHVVTAYYLLGGARVASDKLKAIYEEKGVAGDEAGQKKLVAEHSEANFYFSKIKTAQFFASNILPNVFSLDRIIKGKNTAAMECVFGLEEEALAPA